MSGRRRAYRYEVIDTTGEGAKAMADKPHILDWKPLGEEYTWTIYTPGMGVTGTITGRYLDKGYCADGAYKSDSEIAATAECARDATP
jgi:hypothetical protein